MDEEPPRVISVEAAAKLLSISRGSAYAAAACGELPTIRIGRRLLVPVAKLNAMLGEGGVVADETPAAVGP